MTFWAEISKGLCMCVLDQTTTGGVGKGATLACFCQKQTNRGVGDINY